MKKLSLQVRLTLFSALIITICCVTLDLIIMNSAIMKLDQLEDEVFSVTITSEQQEYSLNIPSMIPDISLALQDTKQDFKVQCIVITIVIIVVGTVLTWIISGIVLKPLKKLNQSIGEISANNLSKELEEIDGDDEVADLTRSFNRMLRRINDAFLSQKQFSANAAHELRTPLAILQTNLEVFEKHTHHTEQEYSAVMATTLRQTGHMNHLISSLLELMSLHTAPLKDDIDLDALTEEVLMDLSLLAEEKKITLSHAGSTSIIKGNEVLFYRLVYNLVENAIKYNKEEGRVKVEISEEANRILLLVSDTGHGIPEDHWNEIFRPFYRVDKARSREMGGVGLGLALVSDIASLHNGQVYVKNSSSEGTEICIEIQK